MSNLNMVIGARTSGKSTFVNSFPYRTTMYIYPHNMMMRGAGKVFGRKDQLTIATALDSPNITRGLETLVVEEVTLYQQYQLKQLLKDTSARNIYLTLTPNVVDVVSNDATKGSLPFWLRLLWASDTKVVTEGRPHADVGLWSALSPRVRATELEGKVVIEHKGVWTTDVRAFQEHYNQFSVAQVILE